MTRPLSMDIRSRLVSAVMGGMTRRSAATRFGIAASTAIKWVEQWERTGKLEPRRQGGIVAPTTLRCTPRRSSG